MEREPTEPIDESLPSAAQWKYDFFIAYAGPDEAAARDLHGHLSKQHAVFLDKECLVPGDRWDIALPRALRDSRIVVVLISDAQLGSWYSPEEIARAISHQRKNGDERRVVPVYLKGKQPDEHAPYGLLVVVGLEEEKLGGLAGVAAKLSALVASKPRRSRPGTPPRRWPLIASSALLVMLAIAIAWRFARVEPGPMPVPKPTPSPAPPTDSELDRIALSVWQRLYAVDQEIRGLPVRADTGVWASAADEARHHALLGERSALCAHREVLKSALAANHQKEVDSLTVRSSAVYTVIERDAGGAGRPPSFRRFDRGRVSASVSGWTDDSGPPTLMRVTAGLEAKTRVGAADLNAGLGVGPTSLRIEVDEQHAWALTPGSRLGALFVGKALAVERYQFPPGSVPNTGAMVSLVHESDERERPFYYCPQLTSDFQSEFPEAYANNPVVILVGSDGWAGLDAPEARRLRVDSRKAWTAPYELSPYSCDWQDRASWQRLLVEGRLDKLPIKSATGWLCRVVDRPGPLRSNPTATLVFLGLRFPECPPVDDAVGAFRREMTTSR